MTAFQQKLPAPDAATTTELTAAVHSADSAAQLCAGQKFDAMSTQFGVMNAHLTAATERIKTVTTTS